MGVTHPLVKGKALNKKNENFALKILECVSASQLVNIK
jgi:hypothetical protein